MANIKTWGACLATAGTPTPALIASAAYPSAGINAASSFKISKGVATVVLNVTTFPTNGYNPPNNQLTPNLSPPNGQQVVLYGFSTATYFNGLVVSVIANNPQAKSFSFAFNHADVNSTSDAGNTAPIPVESFRAIRLECGQSLGTDLIYVGDGNVSSSRYMACLSLAGQLAIEIAGENILGHRVWIDTSGFSSNDTVLVSTIY